MKSPITGSEMELRTEQRMLVYKNQEIEITFSFYYCPDTKQQFTSTELDDEHMKQVERFYKERMKIN